MRSLILLAFSAATLSAQLAAPNEAGVSIGHVHLFSPDPDAQRKVWIEGLGAQEVKSGQLDLVKLPGIFVMVNKGMPKGGSNGSTVNHIGIAVKDYAAIKAKLAALNVPMQELTPNQQMFATFPDDVRIEIMEVKDQEAPVAFHHMHLSVPDPEMTRQWYVKTFGAMAGSRRNLPAAMIPGGEVDFLKARTPQEPTAGRSLDHIGFELKDLPGFIKKLEADGVTVDQPQQFGGRVAFLTDPTGTRIELTQGLISR